MKKTILIIIGLITLIIVTCLILQRGKEKETEQVIKDINISDLKIDHLVINVDERYQTDEGIINDIESMGLPYEPSKGKGTKGFKVSNLWIGKEYFEMVRVKNEAGGGWVPSWVDRYNDGERGMICLFLDTDDIDSLAAKLNDKNISEPEKLKYKYFFDLISFSPPWQNAYLPFFEGAPFQIGFQQMDSQKTKEQMYKKMEPNSMTNGISGIKAIEIYGDFTESDINIIKELFPAELGDQGEFTWYLKDGQSISFKQADEYRVKVIVDSEQSQGEKNTVIENVEIIVD